MERLQIANFLCGTSCLPEEHAVCQKVTYAKCSAAVECFIKTLSDQQVAYVTAPISEDIYLKACPGSGKTEVIGIKTAYEVKRWQYKNNGIAVLTFTNSAEKELANRIESFLQKDMGYPHYVGTFTSWLLGYIANPFMSTLTKYKGVDDKDNQTVNTIEDFANFLVIRKNDNVDDYQLAIRVLARAIQRCFFKTQQHFSFEQLSRPETIDSGKWRKLIIAIQNKIIATENLQNLELTWGEWKTELINTFTSAYLNSVPGLEHLAPDFGKLRKK